ncbi:MAG: hypothetical protein JHC33_00205 [Ignisphaera sp.]|nr:hypothetical protein [Ignisphaera sp.]
MKSFIICAFELIVNKEMLGVKKFSGNVLGYANIGHVMDWSEEIVARVRLARHSFDVLKYG